MGERSYRHRLSPTLFANFNAYLQALEDEEEEDEDYEGSEDSGYTGEQAVRQDWTRSTVPSTNFLNPDCV